MSALDDAVKDYGAMRYAMTTENPARAELELLRAKLDLLTEFAFDEIKLEFDARRHCTFCKTGIGAPHKEGCKAYRILRTDPERARRMGLGWAL